MAVLSLYVILLCASFVMLCETQRMNKYSMSLPVDKMISAAGYPIEKHRVYTEDGYILQMHRIPAVRRSARRSGGPRSNGKKAVLIVHGLYGCSDNFVIMGPERSLAFILSDAGYDVWLGNLRGNTYTAHQNLTRNDPAFWEFSFHEHGKYDVPAMIEKVLNVTMLSKIMYIGHSMGTTSFFTMMSQKPEYNDKVISFLALAPAVYMDNLRSYVNLVSKKFDLTRTLREGGILSASLPADILQMIVGGICNLKQPQEDVCMGAIYTIVGEDTEQNEWEVYAALLKKMQPASLRQLEHFGKVAITGVFTSWEDGWNGAVKPYKLSNVKVPVSIFYGENDKLTQKSQIMRLANKLRKTGVLEVVQPGCSWPKFNHLDFVFAKDVGELFNKPLVKHIDKLYNKYGNF